MLIIIYQIVQIMKQSYSSGYQRACYCKIEFQFLTTQSILASSSAFLKVNAASNSLNASCSVSSKGPNNRMCPQYSLLPSESIFKSQATDHSEKLTQMVLAVLQSLVISSSTGIRTLAPLWPGSLCRGEYTTTLALAYSFRH